MVDQFKFHRGITVPSDAAEAVISNIKQDGLHEDQGEHWLTCICRPGNLDALHLKPDLSKSDTRKEANSARAVCACGDEAGAHHYAFERNHSPSKGHDTPIVIEFSTDVSAIAVDEKGFFCKLFELGDPEKVAPVFERSYGKVAMRYARKAWSTDDHSHRIAQCDLASNDIEVIKAHYDNSVVLEGSGGELFRSAFKILLPVPAEAIIDVRIPEHPQTHPFPGASFKNLRI